MTLKNRKHAYSLVSNREYHHYLLSTYRSHEASLKNHGNGFDVDWLLKVDVQMLWKSLHDKSSVIGLCNVQDAFRHTWSELQQVSGSPSKTFRGPYSSVFLCNVDDALMTKSSRSVSGKSSSSFAIVQLFQSVTGKVEWYCYILLSIINPTIFPNVHAT